MSILVNQKKFLKIEGLNPESVHDIMSGQVTKNVLEEIWEQREVEVFIQLMVHFNLLIAVDESYQRYIIPSMLPPQNVKKHRKGF